MSVLRPGDLRGSGNEPIQRLGVNENPALTLTPAWIAAFDLMPFAEMQQRYRTDPQFHALADQLFDKRNPKEEVKKP
jgi:hypothetical protein